MALKNKKIKVWGLGSLILLLTLALSSPGDRYFEIAKNLDIFANLYKEVNALYVDDINPNKIIETGINAMLASLDPYTTYIPEDEIEDFRTQSTGQYGGIGAVTGLLNGKIRVIMLMEGYSAEKNGLKIGDEIIKINNVDVRDMPREATNELMKGQANTPVSLTVLRYGRRSPITLDFRREKVKISNVPFSGFVTSDIGYVKLTEFMMQAGEEVENAMRKLIEDGAEKIILDVRNNPGGLLVEAVNVTNLFLPKGVEVVSTKGKITAHNATYETLNEPLDEDIPLAILINSGSASAAEIVAGTVQDYDRGVIIGERSFGKGLVQVTRPLAYNSQLKVTTAKYYTPSGRCIQALDYSNRKPDGSVGAIPDSLKLPYKTANGRLVFGGGGIDPDIIVEKENLSPIAYALFMKGLIFDFATKYHYDHPEIATAKNFSFPEGAYDNFKQWLSDKDYSYTTSVEEDLKALSEHSREEKYFDDIKQYLTQIEQTIKNRKSNDLEVFREQIIALLEDEIISRYYLEKGSIESTFDTDQDILEAVAVLNDEEMYHRILKIDL